MAVRTTTRQCRDRDRDGHVWWVTDIRRQLIPMTRRGAAGCRWHTTPSRGPTHGQPRPPPHKAHTTPHRPNGTPRGLSAPHPSFGPTEPPVHDPARHRRSGTTPPGPGPTTRDTRARTDERRDGEIGERENGPTPPGTTWRSTPPPDRVEETSLPSLPSLQTPGKARHSSVSGGEMSLFRSLPTSPVER